MMLVTVHTVTRVVLPGNRTFLPMTRFLNSPMVTALVTILVTVFAFNLGHNHSVSRVGSALISSVGVVTVVLLVVNNNNTFGRILMSDNISGCVTSVVRRAGVSPLLVT